MLTMGILVAEAPSILNPYLFFALYIPGLAIYIVVYRLFFHPLAKIPGLKLATLTSLWYVYHVRQGRMSVFNRDLHKKYGPVVRISPNEVSFDSKEAFRAIYTGRDFIEKGDFYWALSNNPGRIDWRFRRDQGDAFAFSGELDMERYRSHRKNIGITYSASSLKKYSDRLDEVVERFVTKLKTQEGQILDLADWIHLAVVECLGAVTLDWSPGFIDDASDHGLLDKSIMHWREVTAFGSLQPLLLVAQKWPWLRPKIAKLLGVGIKLPANYVSFDSRTQAIIKERTAQFLSREKEVISLPHLDMLDELLQVTAKRADWKPHCAATMAGFNFLAGHETTTSAATSTLVSIFQDAEIEARVRPATSLALWRKVPAGHMLTLHVYELPPGTTVGVNAPALAREPGGVAGAGPHESHLVPAVVRGFDVEIVEAPEIESMRSFTYIAIQTGFKVRFKARASV
ncbi:hypothetical protein AAE478_007602 [Parahypoxylon ruwenzoriense]